MCGICGVAAPQSEQPLSEGAIDRMTAAIAHRGPDDSGIFMADDGRVALGSRRLSIIDLSPAGHMPMANSDRSVWLTYNGEIYNYQQKRAQLVAKGHRFHSKTDTEVVLQLYERRGLDCFKELNGMFAVAIWDARQQRLVLARDPFGIKPLYYTVDSRGQLAFASEVKSLIAGGMVRPEVNLESLHHYLNFLWVPGPTTMFKGVQKLQPGHVLTWSDGKIEVMKYAELEPIKTVAPSSERVLAEELRAVLRDTVRRQLVSDVPLGVFLSGGLDSSAILALATQISRKPLKAYTINYRPEDAFAEQSSEDSKYASIVARQFGAEHHEIEIAPDIVDLLPRVVEFMDEPVADPAAITSYLICRAASKELTVLLSGMGGDEIFGGYRVHLVDRLSKAFRYVPAAVRRGLLLPAWDTLPQLQNHFPGLAPGRVMAYHRYIRKVLRGAGYAQAERYVIQRSYYWPGEQSRLYSIDLKSQLSTVDSYATHLRYFRPVDTAEFVDQMLYVDQHTFLPELNLTYGDKMSMAASVEVRVPLLDNAVAEFMRSIPAKWKISGLTQKYLFKRAMGGILPDSVIWRGKAGFGAPLRSWLSRDLRDMVHEYLSPRVIASRGYFDNAEIQRMIRANQQGAEDHVYRIWALVTLEQWHRTFIDGATAH